MSDDDDDDDYNSNCIFTIIINDDDDDDDDYQLKGKYFKFANIIYVVYTYTKRGQGYTTTKEDE